MPLSFLEKKEEGENFPQSHKFLVISEGIMPSPEFNTLNSGPFSPTKDSPPGAFVVPPAQLHIPVDGL